MEESLIFFISFETLRIFDTFHEYRKNLQTSETYSGLEEFFT